MTKMGFLEKVLVNSKLDYCFHKYLGVADFIKNITLQQQSHILEIGCGTGITTQFIAKTFTESSIIATDIDPEQIKVVQRRGMDSQVTFQVADVTKLPFDDSSFDVSFSIMVFHHIKDFSKAISEVYRVLKPGGKFLIYDIPAKKWNPLFPYFEFGMPGIFSFREFMEILQKTGFRVEKVRHKFGFRIECVKL